MKIAGATVLLSGGASGIGLACARHLCALGARVFAVDRDLDALRAAEADGAAEENLRFLHGDVGEPADVERVVGRVEADGDGIDILVNNAAVLRDQALVSRLGKRIRTHSLEDWNETLSSNLTGTFLMARAVGAAMIAAKRPGLIVNTTSVVRPGNPGQSAYAATKAAVASLTVTWSRELAPYRIRVAALSPGFVETGMTREIPAVFVGRIRAESPVGRFGTVDEMARGLEFIIDNDYFSGRALDLDGGLRF